MAQIGYIDLLEIDQDHDIQITRLENATSRVVRSELKARSMRTKWIELEGVMKLLRAGDELVILRAEHVARSARDLLKLVNELASKGVSLNILEPEIAVPGEAGSVVIATLNMLAELELKVSKDRQRAGIEAGKAAGSYKGRLKSVDDEEIRRRVATGESKVAIARAMNISRMTIYRAMGSSDNNSDTDI